MSANTGYVVYQQIFAICNDPDTLQGLALAEVPGQLAHTPEELREALENTNAGLIIINAKFAEACSNIIEVFRAKHHLPLITVIPDQQSD